MTPVYRENQVCGGKQEPVRAADRMTEPFDQEAPGRSGEERGSPVRTLVNEDGTRSR